MATCTHCNGAGGAYGDYASCYSCGGSGRGSHSDVACMACGGSGSSGSRSYDTCWVCGGSGQVADFGGGGDGGGVSRRRRSGVRPSAARTRTQVRSDLVAILLGYLGGAIYLSHWQGMDPTQALALAIFPALIAGLWWRGLLVLGVFALIIYLIGRFR